MQHLTSTVRAARLGIKLLASFALLAGIAATSSAMAQSCQSRPRDCSQLGGGALDSCLVWNGRIQHACNEAARYEELTGRGPRYRKDIERSQNAGSLDSATDDDQPAPKK